MQAKRYKQNNLTGTERADRSGVDRDIRNVEAAGSNPAQSTFNFLPADSDFRYFFKYR